MRSSCGPAFVLVRVELTPLSNPPRGNWKETWQQCLEILRRCVYLDKDLVLPPMGTSGSAETFFVVASTDLQRSGIMTTRIREQLDRVGDLKTKCTLTISPCPLSFHPPIRAQAVNSRFETVADRVTQMIMTSMERKQSGRKAQEPNHPTNEPKTNKEKHNAKTEDSGS